MTTLNRSLLLSICMLIMIMPAMAVTQSEIDPEVRDAIQKGDITYLSNWYNNGGDINELTRVGNTAVFLASRIGDKPMVAFLLSHSSDVNIQNKAGATALMVAAKYVHQHVVDRLCEHGADPTIRNNSGVTASRFALAYDHYELSQKLQNAMLEQYRKGKAASRKS